MDPSCFPSPPPFSVLPAPYWPLAYATDFFLNELFFTRLFIPTGWTFCALFTYLVMSNLNDSDRNGTPRGYKRKARYTKADKNASYVTAGYGYPSSEWLIENYEKTSSTSCTPNIGALTFERMRAPGR